MINHIFNDESYTQWWIIYSMMNHILNDESYTQWKGTKIFFGYLSMSRGIILVGIILVYWPLAFS
jgi:hypothetical protein